MLTCKEASALVSQSLDRRLLRRERWALRLHLFLCNACSRFKRQIEFLCTAVRHSTRSLLGLSPLARERLRVTLGQRKS